MPGLKKCPKCNSSEIYRKSKHDLVIWCNSCGHNWETNQVAFPIQEFKLYKSKGSARGTYYIFVWLCPQDKSKFSFSLSYGGGIARFEQFPEDPYLKGVFNTSQDAINAGIEEVYRD